MPPTPKPPPYVSADSAMTDTETALATLAEGLATRLQYCGQPDAARSALFDLARIRAVIRHRADAERTSLLSGPASCGCGSGEVASIDDPRADDFEIGPEMFTVPIPPEAGLSLDVRLRDEETREPIPARTERLACTRAGWPEVRAGVAAMTGQIERPTEIRVATCWRVRDEPTPLRSPVQAADAVVLTEDDGEVA